MTFQERFKQLRKEKGVNISKLSRAIGVSRFAIMKWEKGETKPTMEVQKRLCEFFNVTSDYLMCMSDNKSFVVDNSDQFIIDLSKYSFILTDEQKQFILELAKQSYNLRKNIYKERKKKEKENTGLEEENKEE